MIDLTKKITIMPMTNAVIVTPSDRVKNPNFFQSRPTVDDRTRTYPSVEFEIIGDLYLRQKEIAKLIEESAEGIDDEREAKIDEWDRDVHEYVALFQDAPRTKLERDKLLAMLKKLREQESLEYQEDRDAVDALIAEIEGGGQ